MRNFSEWAFHDAPMYITALVVMAMLFGGFFYVVFAAFVIMNVSIILGVSMLTVAPITYAYWAYTKAMKDARNDG